jgi:hypothetical protein
MINLEIGINVHIFDREKDRKDAEKDMEDIFKKQIWL